MELLFVAEGVEDGGVGEWATLTSPFNSLDMFEAIEKRYYTLGMTSFNILLKGVI